MLSLPSPRIVYVPAFGNRCLNGYCLAEMTQARGV